MLKKIWGVVFVLLSGGATVISAGIVSPACAGTSYGQAVGNPPPCTSLAFKTWCARLYSYRLTESPIARQRTYYFSQSGSDSGTGTLISPWKTLAKANAVEAALQAAGGSAYVALAFRHGDTWRETPPATTVTAQSGNAVTIPTPAPSAIVPGEFVQLTGGIAEYAAVTAYDPATGVVTCQNIMNAGHTGLVAEAGLTLGAASQTVTDYADGTITAFGNHTAGGPKPSLSQFVRQYYISDWKNNSQRMPADALANTFTQAETGTVAWVRTAGDATTLLRKQTSAADVDAHPGSWYWDGKQLWLSALTGGGPVNDAARLYEAALDNHADGILTGDYNDLRIHNLAVEGYGASATIPFYTYRGYGICGQVTGTHNLVVDGCDAFYNGRHSICNVIGSAGGIFTVTNCRTGYTTADGINCIAYAALGGQEGVFWRNEAVAGQVAMGQSFYNYFAGSGQNSFAHTSGGQAGNVNRIGLFLSWYCTNRPGQYQIQYADGPDSTSARDYSDLVDCRSFVVGEKFSVREPTALDATFPNESGNGSVLPGLAGNTAFVNCQLTSRLVFDNYPAADRYTFSSAVPATTTLINTTLITDFIGSPAARFSTLRSLGGFGPAMAGQWYNCRLHIRCYGGIGTASIDRDCAQSNDAAHATSMVIQNSILSAEGLGQSGSASAFWVGVGNNVNDPAQMVNNCYVNAADKSGVRGYDRDPYFVEAADLPLGPPGLGSPLLTLHNQLVQGRYKLEYDADWTLRSSRTPAIGPYEPPRLPSF